MSGSSRTWLPYRRGLWSARMADRVARLVVWAAGTTSPRIEAAFSGLSASIGLGRRMLRLREHVMLHDLPREGEAAVTLALRRLGALARAPDRAAAASRLAGERLAHLAAAAGGTQALPLARAATDLLKIAGTIEAQREFFQA